MGGRPRERREKQHTDEHEIFLKFKLLSGKFKIYWLYNYALQSTYATFFVVSDSTLKANLKYIKRNTTNRIKVRLSIPSVRHR